MDTGQPTPAIPPTLPNVPMAVICTPNLGLRQLNRGVGPRRGFATVCGFATTPLACCSSQRNP